MSVYVFVVSGELAVCFGVYGPLLDGVGHTVALVHVAELTM